MSNLHDLKIPPIKIKIDGKDHTLAFDLNTFADIQDKYEGKGEMIGFFNDLKKYSPKAVRLLLWASLHDEKPDLTEREAGKMLSLYNMGELLNSVVEALNGISDSLPQLSEELKNLFPSQIPKPEKK